MSNLQSTQDIYAAFARGDIPAILDRLADDVDWSYSPEVAGVEHVPMLQNLRTPAEVGAVYFGGVGATMDVHVFSPRAFFETGDDVIVLLDLEYTVRPTGRKVAIEEIHHFTFDADGKIARYRPFLDTATVIAAYMP